MSGTEYPLGGHGDDRGLDFGFKDGGQCRGIGVTYGACTHEELTALPNAGLADTVPQLKALLWK